MSEVYLKLTTRNADCPEVIGDHAKAIDGGKWAVLGGITRIS